VTKFVGIMRSSRRFMRDELTRSSSMQSTQRLSFTRSSEDVALRWHIRSLAKCSPSRRARETDVNALPGHSRSTADVFEDVALEVDELLRAEVDRRPTVGTARSASVDLSGRPRLLANELSPGW
jgi:hypothetical protein